MPSASVIITTHNRPHLLPRAVESARSAGKDLEIIVVDDASTDETAAVCQSISGIRYLRVERNQQVAGARNIGLVASRGKYITFLDDDDTRLPDTLNQQIEMLERSPEAGLIYGRAILGNANGEATNQSYPSECPKGDLFWRLLGRNIIPCGSVTFRRSCLSRVGLLDDQIPGLDDWDLWIRISEIYPIVAVDSPMMIWRRSTPMSAQGTSHATHIVSHAIRQFRDVWMKLPRAAKASAGERRLAWRSFSENMFEHLVCESARAGRCGKVAQSVAALSLALRLPPTTAMRVALRRLRDLRARRAVNQGDLTT
ncbi:MAG: glycosyltransferase family 2 protein [Pyrinomonadaceae bacterium]